VLADLSLQDLVVARFPKISFAVDYFVVDDLVNALNFLFEELQIFVL